MLRKGQKYARTTYIHNSYRAKDIKDRFPNMKSIMYTNRHNKSRNNLSTITNNVDEKAKYSRTDYIHRSYGAKVN